MDNYKLAKAELRIKKLNMQIKELKKSNEKYLEILKKNGYIGD